MRVGGDAAHPNDRLLDNVTGRRYDGGMTDLRHADDIAATQRTHSGAAPRQGETGLGGWIGFWLQLVVLAFLALLGAFFASANRDPGDYACGLILAVAAVLLLFFCIKAYFDGNPVFLGNFLLVDDTANLVLAIVIFAALGLAGVFAAASAGGGGLYVGGIALFAVSALAILLSMKRVFDALDRRP
jgi:hypothetical protein